MSTRNTIIFAIVLITGSLLAGVLLWDRFPNQMASHWNINDQVDGTMSRFWGVFILPVITTGMLLLFMIFPMIDPLKANIAKFRPIFNLFIVLIILFMTYIWTLTIFWNLGSTNFKMSSAMLPAIGLLFLFLGYLLRKAKRNWFIGIRTPWTLSSDRVWDETHRLGSVLFYVCAILALAGYLFGSYSFWFVIIPTLSVSLFLIVYSYFAYRREQGVNV
ncbi:MAG: hypothetical protein A2Y54_07945 [Chloroflexi bacterium RBG_16_51_16]|nr:MAG: hypothetical protein A2Y54_07945 [Chloroflexi bacterium RBG_16_51_16]